MGVNDYDNWLKQAISKVKYKPGDLVWIVKGYPERTHWVCDVKESQDEQGEPYLAIVDKLGVSWPLNPYHVKRFKPTGTANNLIRSILEGLPVPVNPDPLTSSYLKDIGRNKGYAESRKAILQVLEYMV